MKPHRIGILKYRRDTSSPCFSWLCWLSTPRRQGAMVALCNHGRMASPFHSDSYGSNVRPAQALLATVKLGKATFLPSREGMPQIAMGL